ncbi:hypothetical protein RMCBS344292_13769 [Rhizopus microsporus]|nr:hypothetical protein RMCBS344292_13769 [Rhizopus microsporus]
MDEQEKRRVEESLLHKIDHRPTPEELVQHNILKGKQYFPPPLLYAFSYLRVLIADPTEVAPALQKSQFELERSMIHDSLENKLHERPDRTKLIEQGILEKQLDELEKKRIEESLLHKIDHRPTPKELIQHNILKADPTEVSSE